MFDAEVEGFGWLPWVPRSLSGETFCKSTSSYHKARRNHGLVVSYVLLTSE